MVTARRRGISAPRSFVPVTTEAEDPTMDIQNLLDDIVASVRAHLGQGEVAGYIPELSSTRTTLEFR